MPSYSGQELAERALRMLGVLANGQTASADDVSLVSEKIEGMFASLVGRGVYSAQSIDEVRPEAFDALAACLAYMCRNEFQVSADMQAALRGAKMEAEYELRALNNPDPPLEPVQASYF